MSDSPSRDMTKSSMSPYLLMSWGILTLGWILMLSGIASLQEECGNGTSLRFGGYMGSTASCSKLYGYSWFICMYTFVFVVLTPLMVIKDLVGKCRACFIGLLATLTMLIEDMSNTFLATTYVDISSTFTTRCRATSAGAIICSMAAYLMLIFVGIVDEDAEKCEKTGAPTTQTDTRGGYYVEEAPEKRQPGSEYTSMS